MACKMAGALGLFKFCIPLNVEKSHAKGTCYIQLEVMFSDVLQEPNVAKCIIIQLNANHFIKENKYWRLLRVEANRQMVASA